MAKIVLIDPDTALCESLRFCLDREGYDTLVAHGGGAIVHRRSRSVSC